MFTLIQLSDCHLARDPSADYRGQNADVNLQRLFPAIRAFSPDGIVLSGDLSEDASVGSYQRAAALISPLAPRLAWLPGNHDDRAVMAEQLPKPHFEAGPLLDWGGWQIVLLDSAVPDQPSGLVDQQRLEPLDQLDQQRPALAFIHHQPLPVDAPWIDKYGLKESELLWQRLAGGPVQAIGFGHVHQAFIGERAGIACLSAPSSVANSQSGTERFTPDPTGPKARWYRLHPDGRWQTGLISAGMN